MKICWRWSPAGHSLHSSTLTSTQTRQLILSTFGLQSSPGISPAAAWNSEEDVLWHMSGPGWAVTKLGCSLQRSCCWKLSQLSWLRSPIFPLQLHVSALTPNVIAESPNFFFFFCGHQPANDSSSHYLLNCSLKTDIKTDRPESRYKRFSVIRVYSHPTTSASCDM